MSVIEHFRHRYDQAYALFHNGEYQRAKDLAREVAQGATQHASKCEKVGSFAEAIPVGDVATTSKVLLQLIEMRLRFMEQTIEFSQLNSQVRDDSDEDEDE